MDTKDTKIHERHEKDLSVVQGFDEEVKMQPNRASTTGHDFDPLSQQVINAALTVHRELGSGFMEITYQRALAIELQHANIACEREVEIPVYYRDELIDTRRADFVVGELILELKAVDYVLEEHISQLAMYLKATKRNVGLLLNFGEAKLKIKRVVH